MMQTTCISRGHCVESFVLSDHENTFFSVDLAAITVTLSPMIIFLLWIISLGIITSGFLVYYLTRICLSGNIYFNV